MGTPLGLILLSMIISRSITLRMIFKDTVKLDMHTRGKIHRHVGGDILKII